MSWLLILPMLLPLSAAVLAGLTRSSPRVQGAIGVAASVGLLVVAIALMMAVWQEGILVSQMSNWPAPFGITLVADTLSAVMVLITAIVGLATVVYSLVDIDRRRVGLGYHIMLQVLLAGVCGSFLTGDLFNLYVWFEVMLIASFGLLVLGGDREQLKGGVKYVALNLVSTISFLSAVGLLYGMTGTLNMADLHGRIQEVGNPGLVAAIAVMFMVGFGIKSAVFPLFFWLPASYHTPPVAISAVFAGLLTKVGVYALIRLFTLVFSTDVGFTHEILLWVAALTMITGVLGAAAQNEIRRILSFHIISQIGYMVLGLALMSTTALAGAVFYLVHHIIVKANLFFVGGVAKRLTGSADLSQIGGLYKRAPLLGVLFLIPAFSLAGFPPLSGFWAKLFILEGSLRLEEWVAAGVVLVVGLLTIFSMTKIWGEAFWKPAPEGMVERRLTRREGWLLLGPVVVLAVMTVIIGLWVEPFWIVAERAAAQLLDPSAYVEAVLGVRP
ncbi:Na+/H+ antiporter subunit D [Telmatospirillum sp. J64-1]|uniref:Na+/H+ antiporter subunit D n=1 Tax=Telmatospirillum sp. J64-1 TaxID=2502183 RepID=UPI00115CE879|nr:Na+/H+ antiporter subunit D [Telmatospirillum sp. J64-1]